MYTNFTVETNPGEFAYLFDLLPSDLTELCAYIKRQLIHPSQLSRTRHLLAAGMRDEDHRYPGVIDMLQELLARNPSGMSLERLPEERLIVTCRFHTMLLASILRYRGFPARCRVGFARYLSEAKAKYIDHWVCEVWSPESKHWVLVDPDIQIVDIPPDDFLTAGDAWLLTRSGEMNANLFGIKRWWGPSRIRNNLCLDLWAVLGKELRYEDLPPICQGEVRRMKTYDLELLDEIAMVLQNPDDSWDELRTLACEHAELQFDPKVGDTNR